MVAKLHGENLLSRPLGDHRTDLSSFSSRKFEGPRWLFNIATTTITTTTITTTIFTTTTTTTTTITTAMITITATPLQLSLFQGRLARKDHFHIFTFQIMRDVSHERFGFISFAFRFLRGFLREGFVFTSFTFGFWGESRTKLRFGLPLADFDGGRGIARNAFLSNSGCTKSIEKLCFADKASQRMNKTSLSVRRTVSKRAWLGADHCRTGPAVELTVQASICRCSCA